MSSKPRNVQVEMVRILWPDKQQPITHRENVTVGLVKDPETESIDLRIAVNRKMIISEELDQFQWLEQSSTDGVVTIDSSTMKLIIIYEPKERGLLAFFAEMEEYLRKKPSRESSSTSTTSKDQSETTVDDLVKSIENGSQSGAERAAKYLAQKRTNVQFNLSSRDDHEENETTTKKSEAGASSDILQLQLRVECHLDRKPLVATIYVRSGTNLRALKDEIENETGIKRIDQYWYAFGRYLISDDYKFGSTDPVVPPRPINAPRNQPVGPKDPIRSGDEVIMCIAQMRPFH